MLQLLQSYARLPPHNAALLAQHSVFMAMLS
jgi:hypothetical protein